MSLKSAEDMPAGTNVDVSFSLLTLPRVSVRGGERGARAKIFLGSTSTPPTSAGTRVKEWIDAYLES